jgi:GNAT superfamily N-acetyltransferase
VSLSGCLIRSASRHEIPEIEAVSVAAYAHYRGDMPAAIFDSYLADLRRLAQYWEETEVLVADLDGRIAGSVLFYADASSEGLGLPQGWAGFRKLAVHPEARGLGLGRELVGSCVDLARRLGAPTVGIHTTFFMKAACGIYEQMGFRRCPQYDVRAADILGLDAGVGEVKVIAYRLDLDPA